MKKTGKMLSILLALVMITGAAVPLSAGAQTAVYPTIFDMPAMFSGDCGKSTTYNCFPDGSMGIFGTGAIEDFSLLNGKSTAPWYKDYGEMISNNYIYKIAVEYGVTHIGDYSFYLSESTRYVSLNNIDIANTVTSIGKYAFYNQKLEEVILPPTVTEIGENAFGSMEKLKKITYYGDPASITNWDSIVTSPVTVHILKTRSHANTALVTFVSDMDDPYAGVGDKERNIGAYYGSANSSVFAGAAPFIIVGKFNNVKKSVTHGSTGFATCIQYGTELVGSRSLPSYYLLTDNANGSLNRITFQVDAQTQERVAGIATGYDASPLSDLSLHISHEYIGPDTVKMIYTLKNNTDSTIEGVKLGSAGDIKIGADDKAAITPIMNDADTEQIGFYMISTDATYDKNEAGDYSTLGFIGKNVETIQGSDEDYYPEATFFYGTVANNAKLSATGARQLTLLPERVFQPGTGAMHEGTLARGTDSGMSYFWEDITLLPDESKQFAVLFSVYGATDATAQEPPRDDSKADDASDFLTVTWMNGSTELCRQSAKSGDTPAYPLTDPQKIKAPGDQKSYSFVGWSTDPDATEPDDISSIEDNTTYYAVYEENRLFKGHSLSLDGDIGLNFFVDLRHEDDKTPGNWKIRFDWTVNGEEKYHECWLNECPKGTEEGTTDYYVAKCTIPAAEMAYNIHATAYHSGSLHWDKDVYSVKDYCMDLIGTTDDADLMNLAEKTLNYGTKAQILFHRENADLGLADSRLSPETRNAIATEMSGITTAAIRATINAQNNDQPKSNMNIAPADTLQYAGSSLVCLTTTSLRHYYKIKGEGYPITAENFTFHDEKDGFIYFEYVNIAAPLLDKFIPFNINGKTYYYSPLDYVGNTLLSTTSTNEEKELARSVYLYNTAANAYYDKLS